MHLLLAFGSAGPLAAQEPPPDSLDSALGLSAVRAKDGPTEHRRGFRQSDPVPPRVLYRGFLEPTAHTLPRGRGYVGAGYMGADYLAQIGTDVWNAIRPYVVHGAYGVTDDLTLGMGAGFIRFRGRDARFEHHPYVTAKFRVLGTDRSSAAFGGFWGPFTWSPVTDYNLIVFGLSFSYSERVADRVGVNSTIGMYGNAVDRNFGINRATAAYWGTFSIGAEVRLPGPLGLVGELRSFGGIEAYGHAEVWSVAARYLDGVVGVEVGVAGWLTEAWSPITHPVLGVAYRF